MGEICSRPGESNPIIFKYGTINQYAERIISLYEKQCKMSKMHPQAI